MADDKQKLQYVDLTYVGKEYHKTFENEDKTKTKSYKYKFKEKEEDIYSKNFWGYDNTKGCDTLEEGELTTIGFIERPNKQSPEHPIKVARFFGKPQEEKKAEDISFSDSDAIIPESLKGDWLDDIISNKEVFVDKFITPKSGFDDFCLWLNDKESCDTDLFVLMKQQDVTEDSIFAAKKRLYIAIKRELEETI